MFSVIDPRQHNPTPPEATFPVRLRCPAISAPASHVIYPRQLGALSDCGPPGDGAVPDPDASANAAPALTATSIWPLRGCGASPELAAPADLLGDALGVTVHDMKRKRQYTPLTATPALSPPAR